MHVKRWRSAVRNTILGAAAIFGLPYAYDNIARFIATDPFVGLYKRGIQPIDESIGIRMDGVQIRDYKGPKLMSSAFAGRIDVRRDRQALTLYGVKNGVYAGSRDPVSYSAQNAVWNIQTQQVTVTGGVEVKNKDMDVRANDAIFDDRQTRLRIQGKVTGKLFAGDIMAAAISYNTKSGAVEAGPVEWQGTPKVSEAKDVAAVPTKWDIQASHVTSLGSKTDTFIYTDAMASDKDLILKTPLLQQNRKTDVLTASGGIKYYSGQTDITADSCVVYRKEKRVVLTGHVLMYVKPKSHEDDPPKVESLPEFKPTTPDKVVAITITKPLTQDEQKTREDELRSTKNLRDFPVIVVSDRTEYFYEKGKRHAVITGEPQGRQSLEGGEWRYVWSHAAFYDGEKDTLKLESRDKMLEAIMKNSLGDKMTYDWFIVSTKEDDDSLEGGNGTGSIYSSEEVPTTKSKSGGTAVPPPGGTTPPPTGSGRKAGGT